MLVAALGAETQARANVLAQHVVDRTVKGDGLSIFYREKRSRKVRP